MCPSQLPTTGVPLPTEAVPDGLRITTLNVNGLRSALSKGLEAWLERQRPDVVLLQEVRADPMPERFLDLGYHSAWHPAQKPGYSGVAILSTTPLADVRVGLGLADVDAEGRVLSARAGGTRFASVYLPSGSSGELRQGFKERVMGDLLAWTQALLPEGPLVLGGDYNVAHGPLDIKNWRGNQKNSGFLPHERQWVTDYLALGLTDAHRAHLGAERSEYTWWSNRGGAYANDVGWRIDYLFAAGAELRGVSVDRAARLSDHAPLSATLSGPAVLLAT